jgi:hypothetical protein
LFGSRVHGSAWQTAAHPDPHGVTLRALRRYLRALGPAAEACALFVDYLSLPQKNGVLPRTAEEGKVPN